MYVGQEARLSVPELIEIVHLVSRIALQLSLMGKPSGIRRSVIVIAAKRCSINSSVTCYIAEHKYRRKYVQDRDRKAEINIGVC